MRIIQLLLKHNLFNYIYINHVNIINYMHIYHKSLMYILNYVIINILFITKLKNSVIIILVLLPFLTKIEKYLVTNNITNLRQC